MNDNFSKKSKSYLRIKKVFADNPTAVSSVPILATAATTFQSNLVLVQSSEVPQVDGTIPGTNLKNQKFTEFEEKMLPICNALHLYADNTENMVLAGKVPVVKTKLMAGDEVSQLQRFRAIVNAAKAITPADLVPYNITPAILTGLEEDITELEGFVDGPRSAIDNRMVKHELQDKAFGQMDSFLNKTLDLAVRICGVTFPEFVSAYFLARKLHDGPGSDGTPDEGEGLLAKEVMDMPSNEELQEALAPAATEPSKNGLHPA